MFLQKIDQYILKNILNLTVFYTIIPTLILWIVQSRKIFELAMGGNTSILIILKLSSYLIPPILPHILPFSIILASITVLVRLYNDSELAILWASGLSPYRLIRSFLLIGLMSMIVILLINAFIAPKISRQLKIELFNVKNDIIKTALKPGIIQNIQNGNITIYIDKISGNSFIEGFYLKQKAENNQIRIFTAKQALLTEKNDSGELLLLKGRIVNWHYDNDTDNIKAKKTHRNENKKENQYPTILEFDKFTLNISDIFANFNNNNDLQLKARDYSLPDLLTAKNAKTLDERNHFIATGHEQIITSFLPIIFILITTVMMLRPIAPRGFPYKLILKTVIFVVLFRIIGSALHNFADNNLNIIYVSYVLYIIFIIMMILIIRTRRQTVK